MSDKMTPAEFETLCLLKAVGDGCTVAVLTSRIGLSPSLLDVVRDAVGTLECQGLVTAPADHVTPSVAGRLRVTALR